MQRRSFIRAVASVVPAVGLHDFLASQACAQAAAQPQTGALRVVGAGEDRLGKPHSLGFSSFVFKVLSEETGGGLFIIEHTHLIPGGPPLHLHLNQEEWFYVMEGEVAFQVGEQRIQLYAGESILAPRRVPHTFSSVSTTPSRMLIAFCPAGKMEKYFRDSENASPPADQAAYFHHYDMEFIGPSPFWKA
ncbi:cupin domain-containing protein [Alloacidobacterium sp.]|uniref:cupin domain-containing protein n=1 Tax=Alloacidobacterium sp. TaxID=2951999 RepID=UPI002D677CE9|nr:cupin domain-containing protein [Alloacidobacterium sp.]HYK34774.1 cupin domain-containing protein [Alloacidobacterium sp.]